MEACGVNRPKGKTRGGGGNERAMEGAGADLREPVARIVPGAGSLPESRPAR